MSWLAAEPVGAGALAVVLAYLIGSLSPALGVTGLLRRQDIRRLGTGVAGTANVGRTVGIAPGAAVFFADLGKTALAVWTARRLHAPDLGVALAALAAIAGHNWPLYHGFDGGRGVAVTLAATLLLMPREALVLLGAFALGVATRRLSVCTLMGVAGVPVLGFFLRSPAPDLVFAFGALALLVVRRAQAGPREAPDRWAARSVLHRLAFDKELGETGPALRPGGVTHGVGSDSRWAGGLPADEMERTEERPPDQRRAPGQRGPQRARMEGGALRDHEANPEDRAESHGRDAS